MNQSGSGLTTRIRGVVGRWFQNRVEESVRCSECGSQIAPFDECCRNCGQGNPAKVSISAAVYLTLGFIVLALTLSYLL